MRWRPASGESWKESRYNLDDAAGDKVRRRSPGWGFQSRPLMSFVCVSGRADEQGGDSRGSLKAR